MNNIAKKCWYLSNQLIILHNYFDSTISTKFFLNLYRAKFLNNSATVLSMYKEEIKVDGIDSGYSNVRVRGYYKLLFLSKSRHVNSTLKD